MKKITLLFVVALMAGLLSAAGYAKKGAQHFQVDLDPLNESGVDGKAQLILRGDTLRVVITARGLVPDMLHPQHIHGFVEGTDAVCPPDSAAGEDGILTIAEGLPFYGPVLLPLTPFPMADHGTIQFNHVYDLDSVEPELRPLEKREIVLHGGFVNGEYVPTLPVACGEITVPGNG